MFQLCTLSTLFTCTFFIRKYVIKEKASWQLPGLFVMMTPPESRYCLSGSFYHCTFSSVLKYIKILRKLTWYSIFTYCCVDLTWQRVCLDCSVFLSSWAWVLTVTESVSGRPTFVLSQESRIDKNYKFWNSLHESFMTNYETFCEWRKTHALH